MAQISSKPRKTSIYNLSGAWDLFGKSYSLIRQNFGLFMVLYSIPALLALWDALGRFVGDKTSGPGSSGFVDVFAFGPANNSTFYKNAGGLLFILLIPYAISSLLLIVLWLRTAQGRHLDFKHLWQEFNANWLWLRLIGAIIAVGVATVIGFLLIIVPGIILLWRLFLVPYVLVDQKVSISDAFGISWNMTRGYGWEVYSVLLVMLLLSLTTIIPVVGPIFAFLLTAAYSVAPALRYQELKKVSQAT